MVMEGERRKRKLEKNEEEESEEEKLEKFYALIRSTKDVRDRLANTAKEKDDITVEKEKRIWKPTFQPEDFIDDYHLNFPSTHHHHHHHPSSSKPSLLPSPSTSAKQDNVIVPVADEQPPPPPQTEDDVDEKANDPLDLNLSL